MDAVYEAYEILFQVKSLVDFLNGDLLDKKSFCPMALRMLDDVQSNLAYALLDTGLLETPRCASRDECDDPEWANY